MNQTKPKRELLDTRQAAERLGLKNHGTLEVWRCTGRYDLKFIRVGRLIRYDAAEIERFLKRNTTGGTAA